MENDKQTNKTQSSSLNVIDNKEHVSPTKSVTKRFSYITEVLNPVKMSRRICPTENETKISPDKTQVQSPVKISRRVGKSPLKELNSCTSDNTPTKKEKRTSTLSDQRKCNSTQIAVENEEDSCKEDDDGAMEQEDSVEVFDLTNMQSHSEIVTDSAESDEDEDEDVSCSSVPDIAQHMKVTEEDNLDKSAVWPVTSSESHATKNKSETPKVMTPKSAKRVDKFADDIIISPSKNIPKSPYKDPAKMESVSQSKSIQNSPFKVPEMADSTTFTKTRTLRKRKTSESSAVSVDQTKEVVSKVDNSMPTRSSRRKTSESLEDAKDISKQSSTDSVHSTRRKTISESSNISNTSEKVTTDKPVSSRSTRRKTISESSNISNASDVLQLNNLNLRRSGRVRRSSDSSDVSIRSDVSSINDLDLTKLRRSSTRGKPVSAGASSSVPTIEEEMGDVTSTPVSSKKRKRGPSMDVDTKELPSTPVSGTQLSSCSLVVNGYVLILRLLLFDCLFSTNVRLHFK